MDVPQDLKDQIGPWGWVIASAIMTFAVTAGGAVASAVWWLAKKVVSGGIWLGEIGKKVADGHLKFLEDTTTIQQAQSQSLQAIEENTFLIRDATQATSSKIEGWGSDLSVDAIRKAIRDVLEEAIEQGKIGCKTEKEMEVLVDNAVKSRMARPKSS